eukprot:1491425-Ditylum_brightwellii.AAC.1
MDKSYQDCKYVNYLAEAFFNAMPKCKCFSKKVLNFNKDYMVWYRNEGVPLYDMHTYMEIEEAARFGLRKVAKEEGAIPRK